MSGGGWQVFSWLLLLLLTRGTREELPCGLSVNNRDWGGGLRGIQTR